MSERWTVSEPGKLAFDDRITQVRVHVIAGAVNVVAGSGPAYLEVSELSGPPLEVSLEDGRLTVTYEDLQWSDFSWKSLPHFIDRWRRKRHAVVSLAVPAEAAVEVGSVSADVVVSGTTGRTTVHGASGDTTLVRLSGPVDAHSVSGNVQAQAVSGELKVSTVAGGFTVIEGAGNRVRGNTVSGPVTVDLDRCGAADLQLNTVSGEVAVRMPHPADAEVRADTTSGQVSTAFDELRVSGTWGAKRVTGRLGNGSGRLRITTVSGAVALLRRPEPDAPEDGPGDGQVDFGKGARA
jgi:DUF4097 and DUF4098 domain-containing protein YvlB